MGIGHKLFAFKGLTYNIFGLLYAKRTQFRGVEDGTSKGWPCRKLARRQARPTQDQAAQTGAEWDGQTWKLENACPIGAASGEWQMEDDGGRARTARAEGRWRMTSPRWSRMAAMQPRAATRCQSKAWVGSRDTTRIVSLRIRQTTRLESCPSAPVIASNQQGESPCRSVLALRNRR